jgi:hypothetical protein
VLRLRIQVDCALKRSLIPSVAVPSAPTETGPPRFTLTFDSVGTVPSAAMQTGLPRFTKLRTILTYSFTSDNSVPVMSATKSMRNVPYIPNDYRITHTARPGGNRVEPVPPVFNMSYMSGSPPKARETDHLILERCCLVVHGCASSVGNTTISRQSSVVEAVAVAVQSSFKASLPSPTPKCRNEAIFSPLSIEQVKMYIKGNSVSRTNQISETLIPNFFRC